MEGVSFFNKQDGTVDDLNLAFQQLHTGFKNFILSHYGKGFLKSNYATNLFPYGIQLPIFSQGSSGVNYVNISIGSNPTTIIAGIDSNGEFITITANSAYQNTDPTSNSGNQNIPINPSSLAQPYSAYIWIYYNQTNDQAPANSRVDYDGGLHGGPPPFTSPPYLGPVTHDGYGIYVTNSDPSVYQHPTGLYVGKITVAGGVQTYSYAPSLTTPIYEGQLTAGIQQEAVKIMPNINLQTSVYNNNGPGIGQNNFTLQSHINCFGSALTATPTNPHAMSPNDMPQSTGDNIAENTITGNTPGTGGTTTGNIQLGTITGGSQMGGVSPFATGNIAIGTITGGSVNVMGSWQALGNIELITITGDGTNGPGTGNIAEQTIADSNLIPGLYIPIGGMIMWPGNDETVILMLPNFHICDGSTISKTTYSALYNILTENGTIANPWGTVGVPSGQFKIPDLRYMFPRGAMTGFTSPWATDPDVGSRTTFDGNTPTQPDQPGSYEDYQVQSLQFTTNFHENFGPGSGSVGNFGPGTGASANTNTLGGNETRPVNAFVHFIIRIL
jgi:hypothetical protein